MELHEYLAILRKRWLTIALLTAVTFAFAVLATALATPLYTATAKTFVSVQLGDSAGDLVQGSAYSQSQVRSYAQLATMPAVLDPVIEDLGLDVSASTLGASVTATAPQSTVIIEIAATDPDPEQAATIANSVADQLSATVTGLSPARTDGADPIRISTVAEAEVPSAPSSPNVTVALIIGLIVGMTAGVAAAIGREMLDTKVRSEDDVRRLTEASVIGSIPLDGDAEAHPLIVQSSPHSPRSEAFRRLRTNLQFLDVGNRPRAIVVVSALPAEGKSTTAINLAITLADAGSRVVLVDADLRRPSVAKYLGLEGAVGLTTVLIGQAQLEDVVQPWGNGNLDILTSGQVPPNPSELLGSQVMSSLLKELTDSYDWVLLDTAPLLPVTDGAVLAKLAGGALLVVGAGKVHRQELHSAIGSLESVGASTLGIVVNRLERKPGEQYPYYQYGGPPSGDENVSRERATTAPRRHARDFGGSPSSSWPGARISDEKPSSAEMTSSADASRSAEV